VSHGGCAARARATRIEGGLVDMAEAYCVKDRKMMDIKNPQNITMKNGKPAITGTCENGHKVFRIGKG
jgi:hypothetical protein